MILAVIEVSGGEQQDLDLSVNWSRFSYSWTCVIVVVLTFVMTLAKDLSLFVKINQFGVIFICGIVVFLISMGVKALFETNFTISEAVYEEY